MTDPRIDEARRALARDLTVRQSPGDSLHPMSVRGVQRLRDALEEMIASARARTPADAWDADKHADAEGIFGGRFTPTDDEREALLTEADALVASWDQKGSWSSDSPVGMVMRLAAALRRTEVHEPSLCLTAHPITGARCSLPADPPHAHVCDLQPEPQGEPSDAQRSVPRPRVLHIKGERGALCGVQNPSHVTNGTRYADCADCLAAARAAGGAR